MTVLLCSMTTSVVADSPVLLGDGADHASDLGCDGLHAHAFSRWLVLHTRAKSASGSALIDIRQQASPVVSFQSQMHSVVLAAGLLPTVDQPSRADNDFTVPQEIRGHLAFAKCVASPVMAKVATFMSLVFVLATPMIWEASKC
jgi:hypothetical protein